MQLNELTVAPTWKDVPGYEGRYEVSDIGAVRTIPRKVVAGCASRFLPQKEIYVHFMPAKDGKPAFRQVTLWIGHSGKTFRVARLVALAFHGPKPGPKFHACHGDGDGLNNSASNLRWDTCQGNTDDRTRHGTTARGIRSGRAKLTEQQVREIRVAEGPMTHIAKRYGISGFSVSAIQKRVTWKDLTDA